MWGSLGTTKSLPLPWYPNLPPPLLTAKARSSSSRSLRSFCFCHLSQLHPLAKFTDSHLFMYSQLYARPNSRIIGISKPSPGSTMSLLFGSSSSLSTIASCELHECYAHGCAEIRWKKSRLDKRDRRRECIRVRPCGVCTDCQSQFSATTPTARMPNAW